MQVYVTDKKGNPITDLQKDEFILYDNKDEKQITEFERHALSLPGTAAPAPAAEPAVTAIEPPAPLLNRKFFMLFDLVFTQAKGFRIAKNAALQFLESGLMPTDEASVLLFSGGRSLDVRKLPTRDHAAVREAVESLNISDLLDRVFNESEIVGPQILSGQDASVSNFRPSSSGGPSEIRILAGNFIWALKSFAQALRSQPGQKHVILYSKGIASATIGRGQAGGTYSELSRGYAAMCKELAAAGDICFPRQYGGSGRLQGAIRDRGNDPARDGGLDGRAISRVRGRPPRSIWKPSTISPACIMSSDILSARPGTASSTRSGSRSAGPTARSMRSRATSILSRSPIIPSWRRRSTLSIWP